MRQDDPWPGKTRRGKLSRLPRNRLRTADQNPPTLAVPPPHVEELCRPDGTMDERTKAPLGHAQSVRSVHLRALSIERQSMMQPSTPAVCVNAWHTDAEGNQTYSDPARDPIEGWSVYRRMPDPRGDHFPCGCLDDADFESRDDAMAYADRISAENGAIDIRVY